MDYVVRYGKNKEKEYSYKMFADEIDALLRELIEHGKGLELNMAGLKYGLPFAHPHPDILKHYRELGGEIITVWCRWAPAVSILHGNLTRRVTSCKRMWL
ncbi:MAG: hypothetical protein ACLSGB_13620 [Dorea sp.]